MPGVKTANKVEAGAAYNRLLSAFFNQETPMKNLLLVASLAAALFTLPAMAQQGQDGAPAPQGQKQRGPANCSKAADAAQCQARQAAHQKAMAACKGKAGAERMQCMHEQVQNVDCSKARNPAQCESRKQAYAACKTQSGPQFKQCVQENMPPVDCSKAADPARCAQHQKAREACKDKTGPEHRQCLREHLTAKN
jgi:hypothetical protein